MEDESELSINILGSEYRIRGDSNPEHLMKVASLVDVKMRELVGKGISPKRIAILAALNIADEYLKYQESIEDRVEHLHSLLKKELGDT
jgi:cell division protein ZapA